MYEETLVRKARMYADTRGLELAETLGSGKDGIVLVAKFKDKPGDVAIKILHSEESYRREKETYQRLKQLQITTMHGFNVPQLIRFDDELLVLEMTIVRRPFVLDFASAYLDARPEFSAEIWEAWESEKREQFESRWSVVLRVMQTLQGYGIYLLDVSPSNIAFLDEGESSENR